MRSLNVVSLFSGAGGLDAGFEAAGFRTVVGVEWDPDCCATLRANCQWPVLHRDVSQLSGKEVLSAAGIGSGKVDVLIGGPPCQPFSKSAYWSNGDTQRLKDDRADTLRQYMRLVDELLPEVFVLENVHGISYSGKEEGFLLLDKMTARVNRRHSARYELSWAVLNAADYGVPQLRQRFFLIARRDGTRFSFPQPTHSPLLAANPQQRLFDPDGGEPYLTAWDALGDGKAAPRDDEDLRLRGRWADLLPSIPEGENYLWHTNRKGGLPLFGWRTRYWSFLLKLAKALPSWTIQAQPGPAIGPFHWENRLLGVEEMAAIQTFPRGYKFVGSRQSVQRQIGNAVPSLLAEVIARELIRQCFRRNAAVKPVLSLKRLCPIPPPEPVSSVPKTYTHLAGEHADHPGTGRGRGALRRTATKT